MVIRECSRNNSSICVIGVECLLLSLQVSTLYWPGSKESLILTTSLRCLYYTPRTCRDPNDATIMVVKTYSSTSSLPPPSETRSVTMTPVCPKTRKVLQRSYSLGTEWRRRCQPFLRKKTHLRTRTEWTKTKVRVDTGVLSSVFGEGSQNILTLKFVWTVISLLLTVL